MRIFLNGKPIKVRGASSIGNVLAELDLIDLKHIAVAVNGTVYPRSKWPSTALRDGDEIELVTASPGG